jgi:hypothetical protein
MNLIGDDIFFLIIEEFGTNELIKMASICKKYFYVIFYGKDYRIVNIWNKQLINEKINSEFIFDELFYEWRFDEWSSYQKYKCLYFFNIISNKSKNVENNLIDKSIFIYHNVIKISETTDLLYSKRSSSITYFEKNEEKIGDYIGKTIAVSESNGKYFLFDNWHINLQFYYAYVELSEEKSNEFLLYDTPDGLITPNGKKCFRFDFFGIYPINSINFINILSKLLLKIELIHYDPIIININNEDFISDMRYSITFNKATIYKINEWIHIETIFLPRNINTKQNLVDFVESSSFQKIISNFKKFSFKKLIDSELYDYIYTLQKKYTLLNDLLSEK